MFIDINMITVITCNNTAWGRVGYFKLSHLHLTVQPSIHVQNCRCAYTALYILTLCHFCLGGFSAGGRGTWG